VQKLLTLISATAAFALPLSSPVNAGGDYCYVPMSEWQSRSAAIRWAEDRGWQVHRIKIDDGCYELYGLEGNQRQFEVKLNPATFEIILFEYESHGYNVRIRPNDQEDGVVEIERE
jgi:hypothetical protein